MLITVLGLRRHYIIFLFRVFEYTWKILTIAFVEYIKVGCCYKDLF